MQNDAGTLKTQRLLEVSKQIAKKLSHKPTVDDLSFWIQYTLGLTPKKSVEYIEVVCRAHGWTIEEGRIHQ